MSKNNFFDKMKKIKDIILEKDAPSNTDEKSAEAPEIKGIDDYNVSSLDELDKLLFSEGGNNTHLEQKPKEDLRKEIKEAIKNRKKASDRPKFFNVRKNSFGVMGTIVALAVSAVMMVSVSYAWLTISKSPTVNGIEVSIAGGQTILVAPDIKTDDANGNEVHYPGKFNETLVFSQYDSYDFLNDIAALAPVSTSDGKYWMLPTYTDTGLLNDISQFEVDGNLSHANMEKGETDSEKGSYVCLDFWVVSPGSEYNLRVACDPDSKTGSYLVELPTVVEDEDTLSGYTLKEPTSMISATARVGFLVNNNNIVDNEPMTKYMESALYDSRYTILKGVYDEKGTAAGTNNQNSVFTIYEPNATLHPSSEIEDGAYSITQPLQYDPDTDTISEYYQLNQLTIQSETNWKMAEGSDEYLLEQDFQTAMVQADQNDVSIRKPKDAFSYFYFDYMQRQLESCIECGSFFNNTSTLDLLARNNGDIALAGQVNTVPLAGATDDCIITTLERNVPQRIRLFIWLEGQDVDSYNTEPVKSSGFALGLQLSGQ